MNHRPPPNRRPVDSPDKKNHFLLLKFRCYTIWCTKLFAHLCRSLIMSCHKFFSATFSLLFSLHLFACAGGSRIVRKEICDNGIDDNGNGLTDCADPECYYHVACIGTTPENCTNGIDDNGNGLTDCADPECFSHSACTGTTPENCTNGIDDSGNGLTDCADPECFSHAACQNTCDADRIYIGSPQSCPAGSQCGMTFANPDFVVECRPDSSFAGGSFYGSCGSGNACPFGSICDSGYGCMPFCDAVNNPPQHSCPSNGLCLFSVTTTTNRQIGLCKGIDNCDPVANNCSGKVCVLLVQGTVCLAQTQGKTIGQTCQYADDCAAGLICVGTCERACYLSSGSPCSWLEDCVQLVDGNDNPIPTYGVCY